LKGRKEDFLIWGLIKIMISMALIGSSHNWKESIVAWIMTIN